jgi:hypothetical protein
MSDIRRNVLLVFYCICTKKEKLLKQPKVRTLFDDVMRQICQKTMLLVGGGNEGGTTRNFTSCGKKQFRVKVGGVLLAHPIGAETIHATPLLHNNEHRLCSQFQIQLQTEQRHTRYAVSWFRAPSLFTPLITANYLDYKPNKKVKQGDVTQKVN